MLRLFVFLKMVIYEEEFVFMRALSPAAQSVTDAPEIGIPLAHPMIFFFFLASLCSL